MFFTSSEILQSPVLSVLKQFEHGFGTRLSEVSQDGMASLQQIHSAVCLKAESPGSTGRGDALITITPGLAVSVRTADCLPILLADPQTGAAAAIHAGWRGTAARIVMETVANMRNQFGTRPSDLRAAIGPGIGVCCYEVGQEVARQFGLTSAGHIDLAQANRHQLMESGVPEAQIDVLGLCTFCDPRFHSWRRDRDHAGRMISYIRICA